jgi:hypothetical protein
MNPIANIINSHRYEPWDLDTQRVVKHEILALEIPGLVDVRYQEENSNIRVVPVFDTEQSYVWYHLKYNDHTL